MNIKKIHITENQKERLFESVFRLSELDKYKTPYDMIEYCYQTLGDEISHGSSRIVFPVGDDIVLKISRDDSAGIYQNKQEYMNNKINSNLSALFPKVYQVSKGFKWIEVERVLPIEKEDFVTILGVPWDWQDTELHGEYEKYRVQPIDYKFTTTYANNDREIFKCTISGFVEWAENKITNSFIDSEENEAYIKLMKTNKWFQLIYNYIKVCNGWNDLILDNFGIAMRNGNPTIVILDNGYDDLTKK